MKIKNLVFPFLGIVTLGLSGCSQGNPASSSSLPSSEESTYQSFDTKNSPWGEQIASVMYELYGQDIPFPTGTSKVNYGVTTDDYGDPMLVLMCSFEDSDAIEEAVNQYAISANDAGYSVSSVDYGTGFSAYECRLPYDGYKTLVIQTTYGGMDLDGDGETEDYMGIFVWSEITVDPYSWPTNLIENVIDPDYDIPVFGGEGITYDSTEMHDSDLGNYVSIVVYGVSAGDDLKYKETLGKAGYAVVAYSIEGYYDEYGDYVEGSDFYLAWVDDSFFIQFCYGYDSYNKKSYMDINIAKGDVYDYFDIE